MAFSNNVIIQYFVGHVVNGAAGGYVTMPTSFSNTLYSLVQSYITTNVFIHGVNPPCCNIKASNKSQCVLGSYSTPGEFWTKVIAIGY